MGTESRILSHLRKYGNTKENDFLDFATAKLGCSRKDVKKTLNRLAVKGKVFRIVHNELTPPQVYISLTEPLLCRGLEYFAEANFLNLCEEDAAAILQEAAEVAEKRMREVSSEDQARAKKC